MKDNQSKKRERSPVMDEKEKELKTQETPAEPVSVPEPPAENAAEDSRAPDPGDGRAEAAGDTPVSESARRKALLAEAKEAVQKAREEKKQQRLDSAMRSRKARQAEHERRRQALEHTTAELSTKMKQLLSGELKAMKQQEKTRGAEIMAVFAKHNFYTNGFTPEELRTTLEDLGPTYVKIGQIMSSRVDLLPQSYCKELEKLRQNVKELDPEVARAVIEQETGKKIDEIYQEFRDKPLGSASIGQVHYAVLKDGTKVVTKVQRPLIAEMMRKDFVLLKKISAMINMVSAGEDDDNQMVDLVSVIDELEKVTNEELDFRVEAENTRFFKENCIEDEEKITCPTVIDELTTERIFTMTFVDGYSISKKDRLIEDGYDPKEIGTAILDNYMHQVLDIGTFHADPHQGNIMVSHGKPVWIDFGMIGRISDSDINLLQSLILSLVERDLDQMVNAVMSMGATSPKTSRNKLLEDADVMFDKYMNVTSLDDLDLTVLLEEVTALAEKHHVSLPGRFTMLVRSIATIEGVMEQLCPDLNLFTIISEKLMERAKKNFNLQQELIAAGKDALALGKKASKMPAMTYDLLNNAVKGRMKMNIELTGYEEILNRINETTKNVVLSVFACVLFIGSCVLSSANIQPKTADGQPLISAVGMVFSIALAIYAIRRISKQKK